MKLKNLTGAFLALAGLAFCGNAFAADDGDVDEFVPITETVTPMNALGASRTVSFTMRLLPPDYDEKGGDLANHRWEIAYRGVGSADLEWLINPPKIGVVVSGQTRGAELSRPVPNRQFTDFTCTYTTEFGDYAMPLRVAGDAAGTPAGEVSQYYFFNLYDEVTMTGLWDIRDADDPTRKLHPYRRQAEPDIERPSGEGDHRSNASYDLLNIGGSGIAYYVKTVDFDRAESHQAEDCWRKTNEIGECEPLPAQLTVDGLPENPQDLYFYIWSEDESAVTVQAIGVNEQVEPRAFKDRDGVERTFNVLRIQILKDQKDYTFGIRCLGPDKATNLVMSAKCGYSFQTEGVAEPVLITDFRTALVKYSHEPVQTLSAYLGGDSSEKTYNCSADYATFVDTLLVSLTQKRSGPTKVRLDFKWKTNGVECTAFPTNFLAISATDVGGYREDNLLPGMEITIPESGTSPLYYIYALGSSKDLKDEGVVITPVALDVEPGEIAATKSCRILLNGMKPALTPTSTGTKEDPVELIANDDGTGLKFSIQFADSYRNVHKLDTVPGKTDVYTVTFYRGYGASDGIVFTNSDNTATGSALIPSVDGDGFGVLTIHDTKYASQEGVYSNAWFVIRNPEGLESVKSYATVTVPPRPTVEAEILDVEPETDGAGKTFWRLLESDTVKYDVRFALRPNTLAADGTQLWAFLEPANEAASNRTDGAFFAKAGGKGVKLDIFGSTGVGTTKGGDYDLGGLVVQDGTADEGSLALYNVVLKTAESYGSGEVFARYEGSMKLRLRLVNHKPEFKQLVLRQKAASATKWDLVDSKITNRTTVAASVGIGNAIRVEPRDKGNGWNDVVRDLNAPTNEQIVVRWRVYEYDGGEEVLSELRYTFKTNNWLNDAFLDLEGFPTVGKYKVIANIQDKDMRVPGAVVKAEEDDEDHPSGWIYYTDPDYEEEGDYDTWQADVSDWGPDFTFTFEVSDLQNLVVEVEGANGTQSGDPYYSEYQLPPFTEDGGVDERMRVRLTLGNKTITELRNAVITARVDIVASGDVHGGFVTPWTTNVVFNGTGSEAKRTKTFQIEGFDGTYRNGQPGAVNMAKYTVKATILGDAARYYNVITEDFRVSNVPPTLTVTSPELSEYIDSGEAKPITKGDWIDLAFSALDIRPDLTNMTVTCTITKGKGEFDDKSAGPRSLVSTADSVDLEGGAYTNAFRFQITGSGTNIVKIVAKDKDGDRSEEHQIWFFIEPTHNLILYPSKPTSPTTDSGDIADYFSASGIGYGRVWADSTLSGITSWIQTWATPLDVQSVRAYAMGYRAGEQEGHNADNKPPFVDSDGGVSGATGYTSPLKDLDSFFYRWFARVAGDNKQEGTWTSYLPIPQLSFVTNVVKTQTVLPLEWPQKTGNDATVYSDISALAIFSREFIWSDNMGDINGDGVPDSYVMKYNLVTDYTGGNDLKDVNFETDGKKPYCQDYLPMTEIIAYSKLIPALTAYDNIKNAQAFTPRLKIRGYDDNLNDATAEKFPDGVSNQAFVDGAKPEKRYEMEDGSWSAASCTVSYVEHLAWKAYKAVHTNATFDSWSPERPTDPTKADTDNDGVNDGLEYYWWYRAHVGWLENGVLRKASGRRYDPRNPGEGTVIPAEEIERIFDPILPLADKTQDTDNDGLPDLIEFEIGTNPFDFDSDGDGLPDGFELMIAGTDPTTAYTTVGICDAMRNFDGDAMAFTTPQLEKDGHVQPVPLHTDVPFVFALVDADGDSDGVQWYVAEEAPTNFATLTSCATGTSFKVDGTTYVSSVPVPVVDGRLAIDLPKATTWSTAATNEVPVPVDTNVTLIALMPTRIPAGVKVTGISEGAAYATLCFDEAVTNVNAAWIYGSRLIPTQTTGNERANAGGYGMLAVGRYQDAPKEMPIAALPAEDETVAYLHYLVYQKFGFDPRTAWNANTPLAARWGETVGEGEDSETVSDTVSRKSSYAGIATRTREYTAYDEFLVYSFFVNNGMKDLYVEDLGERAPLLAEIWYANTTNPQGPHEPDIDYSTKVTAQEGGETEKATAEYFGRKSDNGADTDGDGVPDGWELYVMAGPKEKGKFHFAFPYGDGMYSDFGPFVAKAGESSATDNKGTGTGADKIGDGDGLSELQEFAGTDSCAYYAGKNQISGEKEGGSSGVRYAYSTTIVRPESDKWWLNKFFPTDPWNEDTDGDGLKDGNEIKNSGDYLAARFLYGKNKDLVDTGKTCIPGGGLNPCAIDTDMDGLPDAWEAQFAGQVVYEGDDRQMAKGIPVDKLPALGLDDGSATESKESADIPLQGLCDGMDGTVKDAFNSPREKTYDGATAIDYVVKLDGVLQVVDRDYDRDGLENWQEYLTGAMRCWRYDDPITGWGTIPDAAYYDPVKGSFDIGRALAYTGIATEDEFWYRTLFDRESKWYNPHLVTGTSTAREYFSRVTNAWDQAFSDAGTYYLFPDRVNGVMLNTEWGVNHYSEKTAPHKYISTSPILADTDKDGMDDYYELFHGMNPLLGLPDVTVASDGPCDIVFDAWYKEGAGSPVHALDNVWMRDADGNPTGNPLSANPAYDFVAHPWLNGLVTADPDGDDIRNQDEAIMPMTAPSTTWHHTDPTPLWMTDSTYTNSLVYRFFRLPIGKCPLIPMPETITFDGKTFPLYDRDGFMRIPLIGPVLAAFTPDYWKLSALNTMNWIYSFEENEGYDSDHDATSDEEELQGKFRNKTDPQDADSPRRRQAMYFGGPSDPSALQTMPFVKEAHPRTGLRYPDDMSFLQYTVDCWVKPESTADATVLERTSFVDPTHCADERYVRRNFTIAIRNGKWYTAFDANGTMDGTVVEVQGKTDAKAGEWAYVAATYDANRLTLYVNGSEDGYVLSSLKPEYGSSAVAVYPPDGYSTSTNGTVEGDIEASRGEPHHYWFDCEYQLHAFLVGASFASVNEGNPARSPLNVTNARGWEGFYKSFFQGYVDEIRVWDGAQTAEDIAANFETRRRITRDDAIENRSAFFKQWTMGERRYEKDGNGKDRSVIPELRFHWSFDSIPGAENADAVAQAPHGFLDGPKAPWSSPEGYEVPWWSGVVGAYGSVYAGACNWVPWIPNTVAHLPRFDLTTLDSAYWSENYAGDTAGSYLFARTAEPVSKWTQMVRNMTTRTSEFRTTGRRFWLTHNTGTESNEVSTLAAQFDFTGRHLNQTGDDLLPLGGAFARYVDEMWDGQGASSMWEQTGVDADNDGLPDWWQEYAEQNLREGVPEGEDITWNTMVWYEVGGVKIRITAGEAYQRDLAKGAYVDANGEVRLGPTAYAQTAKSDGLIPDWWKELKKIDGEAPLHDLDNDGLNNYVEYVASELLPFRLNLDPRMARSDTKTLDYFRKVGKLYLGEMLTDHDQMEDHWERSLGNPSIANAAVWDALKDGEKDGWTNFAENRYNGYTMGILAQLVSHAMGDNEVLDAPIPSIKMKVRYNGDRSLASEKSDDDKKDGGKAALVVRAYSKDALTGAYAMMPSAVWSVTPGETVDREVYLGCWEDRVVRGTMAPGNIDIDSVDIKFAQILQSDLYSWTDEGGTHVSGTYKEFLAALEKDPSIIQNVQRGHSATGEQLWKSFTDYLNPYGAAAVRAVVVARDSLTQKGVIAVYGERVGTIDLTTGDFEFDLGAMTRLNGLDGTYDSDPRDKWGFKEGIYKLVYQAKVPSTQLREVDFSLAKADSGFIRGGLNSIEAFYDCVTVNGTWDPGEPYGVLNDVDIGWAGRDIELELTDMSAVTPRVKLWGASGKENGGGGKEADGAQAGASAADSDRGTRVGVETFSDVSNRFEVATAAAPKSRVRVVRYKVDKFPVYRVGVNAGVVLEKDFEQTSRDFLHEGDFLADGDLDIDWANLYTDVVNWQGAQEAACEVTNVTYLIVYNWDESFYRTDDDTNSQVKANATLVTRRFEVTRTVPTPCPERAVYNLSQPTFAWKIENEDKWASWFGTTYTAFKVRVKDLNGDLVYDSGIRRLPARDADGVYSWTAPLYVGEKVPGTGVLFENHGNYTWEVAVYNAKFKTDTLYAMQRNDSTGERVFSAPRTFRMNVTDMDASSCALATRVCYAGPATWLEGRIRLQAFASPDFTGDPVAELTLGDVSAEALSPSVKTANAKLIGLPEGNYFLRAYIDTNGNGLHDEWESWGYLNERDRATKPGIFNPVGMTAASNPSEANVRQLLIEDCDTDGDWFPDVWEAEQNKGVFDPEVIKPVTGDAELIGVNTNLDANLTKEMQGLGVLASANGFSLLTGANREQVKTTVAANGISRFSVDNKVDSVTISALDFDADGNVVIRLDAKTSVGAIDPVATAIYDLDLSKTVTCRIYRKTSLASADWGDPVAEETVTVGAGPVTIPVEGEKSAEAFYMAEIIEK